MKISCDHLHLLLSTRGKKRVYECLHCNAVPKKAEVLGVSSRGPCGHNSISFDTYAGEFRCNWCNCTAIIEYPEPKEPKKRGEPKA